MGEFKLTARVGPKVCKERYASLDDALAALEREIAGVGGRSAEKVFGREYAPAAQVAGRFEVVAPGGARAGIDVRGDGSAEAYTGRMRREVVSQGAGEDAYAALARAITAGR